MSDPNKQKAKVVFKRCNGFDFGLINILSCTVMVNVYYIFLYI